ncbi:probable endonuclease 4 [Ornithodoros turicata]
MAPRKAPSTTATKKQAVKNKAQNKGKANNTSTPPGKRAPPTKKPSSQNSSRSKKAPSTPPQVSSATGRPRQSSRVAIKKEPALEDSHTKNGSVTTVQIKKEKNVPSPKKPAAKVKREISKVKRERLPSAEKDNEETPPKKMASNNARTAKVKGSRKPGQCKFVGAHVSVSGGLEHAVTRAVELGAQSFGLFLRSQRQWACKPLTQETANRFRDACHEYNFAPHQILPHGSYLLNCGSSDPEVLQKSRATLVDELKRCEMLGLVYYNFHPGSTCGAISVEECIDRIAESINLAHKETSYVIAVVENMCRQGHTVGGDFRELKAIIDRVKDKSRIGVCLDTCHAFAAGYDLSKEEGFEEMMSDFDTIIGLPYLKALHLNDSKGKLGSHLDRHENIGKGSIGLEGFRRIMNDPRLDHLPMILETPEMDYAKEIVLLYSLYS